MFDEAEKPEVLEKSDQSASEVEASKLSQFEEDAE